MKKFLTAVLFSSILSAAVFFVGCGGNYRVEFDGNGGTLINDASQVQLASDYTQLVIPEYERTGYTGEWSPKIKRSGSIEYDLTFTMRWTANVYTVSIDYGYTASLPAEYTATYDTIPANFPAPVRAGYDFCGWFYREEGEEKTFDTTVPFGYLSNISVYAKWKIKDFELLFDYGDQTGNVQKITIHYGDEISGLPKDENVELPEGFILDKWVAEDGTIFTDGMIFLYEQNVTLTADYILGYHIYYDTDGGILPGDAIRAYAVSETETTLPEPTRTGYDFGGWLETGKETEPAFTIAANDFGTKNYKAVWSPKEYALTLVLGNGEENAVLTATYDTEIGELPADPERTGYDFVCFKFNDGNGETVTAETVYRFAEDVTAFAVWQAKSYSVTIRFNNDTDEDITVTAVYDSVIADFPANPVKKGHAFKGFKLGGESGTTVTASTVYKVAEDSVIVATWQAKSYKLTFDYRLNEQDVSITKTVVYGTAIGELPASPTHDKCVFAGWVLNGEIVTAETVYLTDADSCITAKWTYTNGLKLIQFELDWQTTKKGVPITVTSVTKDGSVPQDRVLAEGQPIGVLPEVATDKDADYIFSYWCYKDKTGKFVRIDENWKAEDFDVEGDLVVIYARVRVQWVGPY